VPAREAFQYAVVRVVPHVERGERVNAGIVLYCRRARFLQARTALPGAKLAALAPDLPLAPVAEQLTAIERIAAGDPAAGPVARQEQSERFHWLVAPASTVVQPSAVHTGLCEDPAATLSRLFDALVA
jgi:DUF3037 family protein